MTIFLASLAGAAVGAAALFVVFVTSLNNALRR